MLGVVLGTFHAAVTLLTLNFLNENWQNQTTGHVELIVNVLQQPDPNHEQAKYLWDDIDFPSKNSTQDLSYYFLNHWFSEILHASLRKGEDRQTKQNSKLCKVLAKFVHSSVNRENKAQFYSNILTSYEMLEISKDDTVFSVGKFVLLDNVQSQYVLLPGVGVGNGLDDGPSVSTLGEMIGPVVWSVLRGRNLLLKNTKFGNFLYVGEIPGRSGGQKEVLVWKSPVFVNINQAIFNFEISGNQNETQTRFRLLHKISMGSKITLNELILRDINPLPKKNSTSSLAVAPTSSLNYTKKIWEVELNRDTNSVIIFQQGQNLQSSGKKSVLCTSQGREFEIDELRRKTIVLDYPENVALGPECEWTVIPI